MGKSVAGCCYGVGLRPVDMLLLVMWRGGERNFKRDRIVELVEKSGFAIRRAKEVLRTCVLRRFADFTLSDGAEKKGAEEKIFFLTSLGRKRAQKAERLLSLHDRCGAGRLEEKISKILPARKKSSKKERTVVGSCGNSPLWSKALESVFSQDIERKVRREDFLSLVGESCALDIRHGEAMLRSMRKDRMIHMDGDDLVTLKKRGRLMLYNAYGIGTYIPSRKEEMFALLYSVAKSMDICANSFRELKKRLKDALLLLLVELCVMRIRTIAFCA